jgi:hypothetical protein
MMTIGDLLVFPSRSTLSRLRVVLFRVWSELVYELAVTHQFMLKTSTDMESKHLKTLVAI